MNSRIRRKVLKRMGLNPYLIFGRRELAVLYRRWLNRTGKAVKMGQHGGGV